MGWVLRLGGKIRISDTALRYLYLLGTVRVSFHCAGVVTDPFFAFCEGDSETTIHRSSRLDWLRTSCIDTLPGTMLFDEIHLLVCSF